MNYQELLVEAKKNIGPHCKVCKVCDGRGCRGVIPGPGGKGTGAGFIHSYDRLRDIKLNMNTLYEKNQEPDTSLELFGHRFKYPIFAGPLGAVAMHYSNRYNDLTYSQAVLQGCKEAGSLAFTGDGTDDAVFKGTIEAIKGLEGIGIPTIKPWEDHIVERKIQMAQEAHAVAIAMDIDAGGLAFLAKAGQPVSPKSVARLKQYIDMTSLPFIVKGVMTPKAALDASEAGAAAIIISNHGGRVLDETPAPIEVLEDIAGVLKGKVKILIDGGFRSGIDVVKALALGADGVVIARPYASAVYGGGSQGAKLYTEMIGQEIADAMTMIGASKLEDLSRAHLFMKNF